MRCLGKLKKDVVISKSNKCTLNGNLDFHSINYAKLDCLIHHFLNMKIDAVGVSSSNFEVTVKFYTILGFRFESFEKGSQHLEAERVDGARLMIDSTEMIKGILGEAPKPSNHSSFAIEYNNPEEINNIAKLLVEDNFKIVKEPWDAFWGQRYCIVQDPDGYRMDLYCRI